MAHPMNLSELLEARRGRPTEQAAARKIATFAVIPAAMLGLLGGTQLVDVAEQMGRLVWVAASGDPARCRRRAPRAGLAIEA